MSLPRVYFPILIPLLGLLIYFSLAPPEQTALVPSSIRHGVIGGLVVMLALMVESLIRRPSVEDKIKPEPERIHLLGTVEPVTLYEAYVGDRYDHCHKGYYSSYELAHRTHPEASVRPVNYYKVGNHYIDDIKVRLRDLQVDSDVKETKEAAA